MPTDAAALLAHTTANLGYTLESTDLRAGRKYVGKVRDVYTAGDHVAVVTTDRLSAFDRLLACVPFKGQVLNLTSAWWFNKTRHIIDNHLVSVPHPNVSVVRRAVPFKVEFVVRSYLTGSTGTSIWVHYNDGVRSYCGHTLPDGMKKNQPLPYNMVTPTTKEDVHDRPITPSEIVSEGLMSQADWDTVSSKALELFAFGQKEAASRGLILVDTKYEFGKDVRTGQIMLIDEIHTPDSSRYWIAKSYEERLARGEEPENIDKEFLRIWFRKNCDPYADGPLPDAPAELVAELSKRYIQLYETITGETFANFPAPGTPTGAAARGALVDALGASVAPLFPPARHTAFLFAVGGEEELGSAAGAAEAALDAALNWKGYGAALPVPTRVAVETVRVDFLRAPKAAAEACTRAGKGRQADKGQGASATAVVVAHAFLPASAEFVRLQSGLPTVAVAKGDKGAAPSKALTAQSIEAAAAFVASAQAL